MAAGLAVVTGRRCTEVIQTAQFEYKTKYSVIFTGALKRKNEPVDCVFEIPTLCEARLVIEAIANLRHQLGEEIKGLSKRQISSRFARAVANKCDRYFSELVPKREDKSNLYTHLFRAIYATIAAYWYCPPTVPEMEFRAAIQGHYQIKDEKNPKLRRSIAAGRNYFDYKISDGAGNIDGRLGIKLHLPDVSVVEQFRAAQSPNQSSSKDSTLSKLDRLEQFPDRNTAKNQSKTNQSQSFSAMNESASSSQNSPVIIPSFFLDRLNAISQKLELSKAQTIQALFTWTEMGLSLAERLEIDEPNPSAVFETVARLQNQANNSTANSTALGNSKPTASLEAVVENTSLNPEQALFQLCNAVELLSQAISNFNFNDGKDTSVAKSKSSQEADCQQFKSTKPEKSSSSSPSKQIDEKQIDESNPENDLNSNARQGQSSSSSTSKNQFESTKPSQSQSSNGGKKKQQRTIEAERDINQAIDTVMEFNNAQERSHLDKWYIGIGSIRALTGRGDKVIRRVLKQRKDVEEHHRKHQLDQSHNLKGRNAIPIVEIIQV